MSDPVTNTHPAKIFIKGINQVNSVNGSSNIASSETETPSRRAKKLAATPSRRADKLVALFPTNKTRFGKFDYESKTFKLMKEQLELDISFTNRMEQCGYISMSIIINRFGLDMKYISRTFAMMDQAIFWTLQIINKPETS